jgi:hypothetical protein
MIFKLEKASDILTICHECKMGVPIKAEITVEINSLEDILNFVNNVRKIIIYPDNRIMIYDDYIE